MAVPKTQTLLLAEDDNDVFFLERALNDAGVRAVLQRVRDGEEAIAYLQGQGDYGDRARFAMPSLVLLDLKMPRRNGVEVIQWLRAQPGLKRLPVVVLTASREAPDISRAYESGANT